VRDHTWSHYIKLRSSNPVLARRQVDRRGAQNIHTVHKFDCLIQIKDYLAAISHYKCSIHYFLTKIAYSCIETSLTRHKAPGPLLGSHPCSDGIWDSNSLHKTPWLSHSYLLPPETVGEKGGVPKLKYQTCLLSQLSRQVDQPKHL